MRDYRRILAVVDFSDSGQAVARRALALARLGQAELALLHLIEPDATLDGGYPPPSRAASQQAYEAEALRRLNFLAANLAAGDAKLLARYGQPRRAFADCVATWQPDLVVADHNPGYLHGGHDLLTLGQAKHGAGGRLIRLIQHFLAPTGYAKAGW
ncbi:MAG: universal stress protein [Gallionellaceae bacterium]|nr:universal stress protein [Gallionellaceae bacterium]